MTLARLPNLGPTIVRRLADVGIVDRATLERVGAPEAYQRLCAAAGRPLPACYYLYSLEAALRGQDWHSLPPQDKEALRRDAHVE